MDRGDVSHTVQGPTFLALPAWSGPTGTWNLAHNVNDPRVKINHWKSGQISALKETMLLNQAGKAPQESEAKNE